MTPSRARLPAPLRPDPHERLIERIADGQRPRRLSPSTSSIRGNDAIGFFQAVNGRYVWMVQGRERARLTAEARQTLRVPCEFGGQCLDSDVPTKLPSCAR